MNEIDRTRESYDAMYRGDDYYWTRRPSDSCFAVLKHLPPERPLRLLDLGCGEGRNAVFFARNGYRVTAVDISGEGIEKTRRLATESGVELAAIEADMHDFRLTEPVDVIFSTGVLHSCRPEARAELMEHYRELTNPGGLHVLSIFVDKPFVPTAPDADPGTWLWRSGELFGFYWDWRIETGGEEIFDCMSGGTPHQHAVNRVVARKPD
jgi:tellurite methyltransferase